MHPVDAAAIRTAAAPTRVGSFPVRRLGDHLAVVSVGARLDEVVARAYAQAVLRAAADGVTEFVLDLSGVRHHAWPAVYALCELEAHLIEACCDPVAVAADEQVIRDLQAVGLERVWTLYPSVPAALSGLLARPVS
jgi:anti-anti-sigma regulatory factor